jgi:hypothetical protein
VIGCVGIGCVGIGCVGTGASPVQAEHSSAVGVAEN